VTRWTATGTHTGEYAGIPATGKRSASKGINIHRVVDVQVQEGWLEWDALAVTVWLS
jgi:predicted ester cyclase